MPKRSDGIQPRPAGSATALSDDTEFTSVSALTMGTDGAALHRGTALSIMVDLEKSLADVPGDHAGVRLHGLPALRDLLTSGAIATIAESYIGPAARPVRAILFDKSPTTNWALGWHQDRTIAVRERHDVEGYGPWSVKRGFQHVEPPFAVIEAMVTLRIHLDAVSADNAPLLIAPGSHRLGKIVSDAADRIATSIGAVACLADRSDIWAYATPILHASERSTGTGPRRVLQVDFSATVLPPPLAWIGV